MRQQTHRSRLVPVLAWGGCVVYAVLWLATLLLQGDASERLGIALLGPVAFSYALVGALITVREPRNSVAWIMLGIATSLAAKSFADAYVSDFDRPLVVPVAWVGALLGYLGFYLVVLALPLCFPDGRLLSTRWRPVAWLGVAALVGGLAARAFAGWSLEVAAREPIPNPLALTGMAGTVFAVAGIVGDNLFTIAAILSIASLLVRLHRARGRRRQQVKWFVFVGSLALAGLLLARIALVAPETAWIWTPGVIGYFVALLLVYCGIPAAVGIAILRHHLYDIDVVIRGTLVYGLLTLALYGVYLSSVVALTQLLNSPAGGNDLAVAASTLAAAALFRPVRGRIQRAVDRRFYRRKYDAARTVESFAARLRHELDLRAVRTDLEVVVRDTMQPAHVSLWLRGTP